MFVMASVMQDQDPGFLFCTKQFRASTHADGFQFELRRLSCFSKVNVESLVPSLLAEHG